LETDQYFLCPLILYVDKTGTDKIQKATLEPLVCISATLNQETRQNTMNWFIVGYLPNLEQSSKAKRSKNTKANSSDYHRCLEVLLKPLKEMQRTHPPVTFRRGEQLCTYRIICPIASIVGDNLSQDKLCGKISNRGPTSIRMTRSCLTPFCKSDTVPHVCHRMPTWFWHKANMASMGCFCIQEPTEDDIAEGITTGKVSANLPLWQNFTANWPKKVGTLNIVDLMSLAKTRSAIAHDVMRECLGSHSHLNAFAGADFGGDSCVHTATMSDHMHSVEEGIIPYLTEILLKPLTDTKKGELDELVEEMFSTDGKNRSGEREAYPRVSFKKGFCSLSVISADEHVGQLFVISILLHTQIGRLHLSGRFEDAFDRDRAERSERSAKGKGQYLVQAHSEDEEESKSEDDMNNEPDIIQEEQTRTAKRPRRMPYTEDELENIMEKLDLEFMVAHRNHLPVGLEDRLVSIVEDKLKPGARLDKVLKHRGELFPRGILDYETVSASETPTSQPNWPTVVNDVNARGGEETPEIESEREECSIKLTMDQFSKWLDTFLAYHAFLKYGGLLFKREENRRMYQRAYSVMMSTLVNSFTRAENTNGFKLQKMVECAHFCKDHLMHGPPTAHNTDTGERGLKIHAKKPARTAQNRDDAEFKRQVINNVLESQTLRLILSTDLTESAMPTTEASTGRSDSAFAEQGRTMKYVKDGRRVGVFPVRGGRGVPKYHIQFPKEVTSWFTKTFLGHGEVRLVNEMTLGIGTDTPELIRAHPNFGGQGPWYDFVLVDYGELVGKFPSRCACFFYWPEWGDWEKAGLDHIPNADDLMVLVHECGELDQTRDSMLYTHYTLRSVINHTEKKRLPVFKCFSAQTLAGRVYVIDTTAKIGGVFWKGQNGLYNRGSPCYEDFDIIRVKDRKLTWPDAFLSTGNEHN
jgi:Plavaka transposase